MVYMNVLLYSYVVLCILCYSHPNPKGKKQTVAVKVSLVSDGEFVYFISYLLTDSSDSGKLSSTESTETVSPEDSNNKSGEASSDNTLESDSRAKKPDDEVGRSCKHNWIVFVANTAI